MGAGEDERGCPVLTGLERGAAKTATPPRRATRATPPRIMGILLEAAGRVRGMAVEEAGGGVLATIPMTPLVMLEGVWKLLEGCSLAGPISGMGKEGRAAVGEVAMRERPVPSTAVGWRPVRTESGTMPVGAVRPISATGRAASLAVSSSFWSRSSARRTAERRASRRFSPRSPTVSRTKRATSAERVRFCVGGSARSRATSNSSMVWKRLSALFSRALSTTDSRGRG